MSEVVSTRVSTYSRELRERFVTALRGVSEYQVIKFELCDESGNWHVGETVETPKITGDTHSQIMAELESDVIGLIIGKEISEAIQSIKESNLTGSTKAAVDIALNSVIGKGVRQEFSVATDVTIPITSIENLPALVTDRVASGFTYFKVKANTEPVADLIAKLQLINELAPSGSHIRIDANQAWDFEHTAEVLAAISESGLVIDYLEQPTSARDFAALAKVKVISAIPIMADESCFTPADLTELIALNAMDLVNLKLLKSGGLSVAREMAKTAATAGIGVYVGSMMEGDQSLSAAATFASEIAPDLVHDLDASWWAKESHLRYESGRLYL
jgi:L-alanine-DL-glutamate epimerase-like enolase superfamily enzyme